MGRIACERVGQSTPPPQHNRIVLLTPTGHRFQHRETLVYHRKNYHSALRIFGISADSRSVFQQHLFNTTWHFHRSGSEAALERVPATFDFRDGGSLGRSFFVS
jgi:hypothetical protein